MEGDDHCSAGHPKKACLEFQCKYWTYAEPVKCACWFLTNTDIQTIDDIPLFGKSLKELIELLEK